MKKLLASFLVLFGCVTYSFAQAEAAKSAVSPKMKIVMERAKSAEVAKQKLAEDKKRQDEQKQGAVSNDAALSTYSQSRQSSGSKK